MPKLLIPGSNRRLKSFLNQYAESPALACLADSTFWEYTRLIEVLKVEIGERTLAGVNRRWFEQLKELWARRGHRAVALRFQVLRNALAPAVDSGHLDASAISNLPLVERRPDLGDRNFAWNELEFEFVTSECWRRNFEGLLRALALTHYADIARGDLCDLPSNARIERRLPNGEVERRLYHVGRAGNVVVDIAEPWALSEIFEQTGGEWLPTLVFTKGYGVMRTRGLNQALDRVTDYLERYGMVRPGLTLTGLRKPLIQHDQSIAARDRYAEAAAA
jgi:hypothetical protein